MVFASSDTTHIPIFNSPSKSCLACCRPAAPALPVTGSVRDHVPLPPRRFPIFIQQEHAMSEAQLTKSLSPMQVCALALGSIVGWGCFVLPGDMFLPSAGPLGTLLGFLAGAILISCFARSLEL